MRKSDYEFEDPYDLLLKLRVDPARFQAFQKDVARRKPVHVLALADYNHDGWATEFVLQMGTAPCGKQESLLFGISPGWPRLHAFGTAEHREEPLVLYRDQWEKLRAARGPLRVVESRCGDHASDEQTEIVLRVDKKGIHAVRETFSCEPDDKRGKRLSREEVRGRVTP